MMSWAGASFGKYGLGSAPPGIQDVANGRKQGISVERFAKKTAEAPGPVPVGNFVPPGNQEDG